jgi:8-oxo-dGTP pyrophosphatase MutT (NUDIX family)
VSGVAIASFPERHVVACLLLRNGRIALFRRSQTVGSGRSLWHCITGYLDEGADALGAAEQELLEEAGLTTSDVRLIRGPTVVELTAAKTRWVIHTFVFGTSISQPRLNWENTEHRWLPPSALSMGQCEWWLPAVLEASGLVPSVSTGPREPHGWWSEGAR